MIVKKLIGETAPDQERDLGNVERETPLKVKDSFTNDCTVTTGVNKGKTGKPEIVITDSTQ